MPKQGKCMSVYCQLISRPNPPCHARMQSAFVADDVSNIIKESVDAILQNQQYNEAKVKQWGCTLHLK